ncbi:ABC transporter permease [Opitutia bacterium ISCC 51]|nr:ABC transporter permease [Opitutae bacterium ISCC 51]QXD27002.1 ABC transporter permease [Opitutae bacterium ISCC 52]
MKVNEMAAGKQKQKRVGPLASFGRFFFEWKNGRIVILSLYSKNYLHKYEDTALGKVWVIVTPIVPVVLYNFLQLAGLFGDPQGGIPRSVFLTYGLTLYYSFSEALVTTTGIITNNRSVIISSGTSKILLSLSEILGTLTNFVVRSILFWIIVQSMGVEIGIRGVSILFWSAMMMSLGWVVGLMLSLFAVIYKDITNLVQIISFYLLFASGVFRQIEAEGKVWDLLRASPLYQIIGRTRDYVFGGVDAIAPFTATSCIVIFLLFVFSITIFYRGERYVDKIL